MNKIQKNVKNGKINALLVLVEELIQIQIKLDMKKLKNIQII